MEIGHGDAPVSSLLDFLDHFRVGHALADTVTGHCLAADANACRKLSGCCLGAGNPVRKFHGACYVTIMVTAQEILSPLWYLVPSPKR